MRRLKALWTRSRGADRRPGHTTRPGRRPAPIGTIDWNGDERRYRSGGPVTTTRDGVRHDTRRGQGVPQACRTPRGDTVNSTDDIIDKATARWHDEWTA